MTRLIFAALLALLLTGVARAEPARRDMIAASNPLAAEAGRDVLRRGGSVIDAAIAAQMVLGLVEPESSGIGGGAVLVLWDAKAKRVVSFDGRETAPQAARGDRFLDADGKPQGFFDALVGGRSVGVPGLIRVLQLAHRRYGHLPWAELFEPAIRLAEQGFPISTKLHDELARDRLFPAQGAAREYFFGADGQPKAAGTILTNPAYAATLRAVAADPDAFYRGSIAADIAAAVVRAPKNAGDMTAADIAAYEAKERPPVCGEYRQYRLCGMGPPSSGGIAVLEILGLLRPFDMKANTAQAWNLYAQASRLAYADRDRYVGDPDFIRVPADGLLSRPYLTSRAKLIDPARMPAGPMAPGDPPGTHAADWGRDATPEFPSTSNIAAIDADGNALAMTTTIEFVFGSHLMVRGFMLNNELTDFSFVPERDGKQVANRIEGGKRPRSSMAPILVFDRNGALVMTLGSAGGALIITDVAKTLIAALDWNYPIQRAIDLPNIGNRNGPTEVEAVHAGDDLAAALAAQGHQIRRLARASGLSGIRVTKHGLDGAVDSRRAGAALGD